MDLAACTGEQSCCNRKGPSPNCSTKLGRKLSTMSVMAQCRQTETPEGHVKFGGFCALCACYKFYDWTFCTRGILSQYHTGFHQTAHSFTDACRSTGYECNVLYLGFRLITHKQRYLVIFTKLSAL